MMKICQAGRDDAESIWAIFQEVVREGTAFVADDSVSRDEMFDLLFAKQTTAFVASQDDRIVGAYMVKPNHPGRGSHVANATYMVHPEARGRGLGRLLGEHSLEVARALGFQAMQFNFVVSTNTPAVNLWQSLGFTIIGTIPRGFQHPSLGLVDAFIMHRWL